MAACPVRSFNPRISLLLLTLCVAAAAPAFAVNLTVGNAQVQPGQGFTVPVTLTAGVGESVGGLQYRITFNPQILSFPGAQTGYADGPAATAAAKGGAASFVNGNEINVVIAGLNNFAMANGIVSNLTFSVLATATAPGTASLTISNIVASTPSATTIPNPTGTNGTITLVEGPETYIGPGNDIFTSPSTTVTMPVMLNVDPTVNVSSVEFQLSFSTELAYGTTTAGAASTASGKGVTANQTSPGLVTVVIAALNNFRIDSGVLANVTFTTPASWSTGGSAQVQFQQITAASTTATSVPNIVTDSCIISVPRTAVSVATSAPARLGQNYVVPISLSTLAGYETSSCQFDLEFDPNVFTYVSTATGASATAAAKNVTGALQPSGDRVRVIVAGLNTFPIGNGIIASITLAVKSTAPLGDTGLYLESYTASDSGAQAMPFAATMSATVTVSAFEPQDINQDNIIDVVDVQLTVNIILSTTTPAYTLQGDANGDSIVDVVDVQTIVNKILAP